ncbi:beta-lactamase family protein [Flavobacteriaceae bacterium]|nr:beta-lactamase family protein [Flavobacteriaceae bacterium]
MNSHKLFFVAVFLLMLSCQQVEPESTYFSSPEKIDAIVDEFVVNEGFPLLYVRLENEEGKVIYEHDAVNRTFLPEEKIDGDTWFRIWSMSKIITISILLDLVEDGLVRLDDPIEKYIPEFKDLKVAVANNGQSIATYAREYFKNSSGFSGDYVNNVAISEATCPIRVVDNENTITVLDLINHQAGFYYATTPFKCLNELLAEEDFNAMTTNQEIINAMAKMPLVMHAGTEDFYGTNTTVLGFVAERATGKSLNELLNERIKIPLGIKGLRYKKTASIDLLPTFSGKDSLLRKATKGELDIMGANVPNYEKGNQIFLGGEGMIGTANGYADFLRMLMNHGKLNGHRFLNEASVKDMYAPHSQLDNDWGYNGYNLWVTSEKQLELGYGDAGLWTGGGYEQTHFWVDPKRKFVGVIMTQMFDTPPQGMNRDNLVRGAIYQQIFEKEQAK